MTTTSRFTPAFWGKLITKAKIEREAREMEQGFCNANLPPMMSGLVRGWRDDMPVICVREIRHKAARNGSTGRQLFGSFAENHRGIGS
jgi:hypothetical protein